MPNTLRLALAVVGVVGLFLIPTTAVLLNQDIIGPDDEIVLEPYDGPNGQYAEITNNQQLTINVTELNRNVTGTGVNPGAQTDIRNVFVIANEGNNTRQIWVTHSRQDVLSFYATDTGEPLSKNVTLEPGDRIVASMRIDTTGENVIVGDTVVATLFIHVRTENLVPDVDAGGPYVVAEGGSVSLTSTAVDPDGRVTSYNWTIVTGPGSLSGATTASPQYQAPADLDSNQTVTVELSVTDEDGARSTDTATITVIGNRPPTGDPGGPYVVKAGRTIQLSGSATDPDGSISRFAWTLRGPGRLTESKTTTPTYHAPALEAGGENVTLTAVFLATDDNGAVAKRTALITVVPNRLPTADPGGPYELAANQELQLSAAGSIDPDGSIAAYLWEIVEGPGSLSNADTATPTYDPPTDLEEDATVTVRLTVTDDEGATSTATVSLDVIANQAPRADAGGPYDVVAGQSVRLDGTASLDPNGSIAAYNWTVLDGPGTLSDAGTAEPTYEPPVDLAENTTVTVRLTVTDTDGATDTTDATVRVRANDRPTADAGGPYTVPANGAVDLDGTGSVDRDGDIAAYNWTIVDGPGSLTGVDSPVPTYQAPANVSQNTTVTVELAVTDDSGAVATVTTTITVVANSEPAVDAGGPYTVDANEAVALDGTESTDPDGEIARYEWTIADGPGSLTGADTATPSYEAPANVSENATVTVRLAVTDDAGATANATATITVVRNRPPTVDASGPYLAVANEIKPLGDAVADDRDGEVVAFDWTIVEGRGSLRDADAATPTFVAPAEVDADEVTTVRVTVTDDDGATATDTTTVNLTTGVLTLVGSPVVEFGEVTVGDAAERRVTLENTGNGPIDLSEAGLLGRNGGQFSVVGGVPPVTLAPGERHTLVVEFAPSDRGRKQARLSVNSSTPGQPPITAKLLGTAVAPNLVVSTPSIDYPQIGRGLAVTRSVTVENTGTADLVIGDVEIEGSGEEMYAVVDAPSAPIRLAPNTSRTFEVRFEPTEAGAFEARLRFDSNDPDGNNATVNLAGTGLPPNIDIDKDHLNFGNVTIGATKTLNITLTNEGTPPIDLTVRDVFFVRNEDGAFEIVGGSGPFTLAPNTSRTVQIEYSPQSAGIKTGQLRIISDADQSQLDVWMSNTGWRIIVKEHRTGERGIDSDTEPWDAPTIDFDAAMSEMDANDVPPGVGVTVNVSVPGTRKKPATVESASVRPTNVQDKSTFDVYFAHDTTSPPISGEETYNVTANRTIVQYLSIEHTIPNANLENTSFTFRLKKSAIEANTPPDEIEVRHLVDGEWERMNLEFKRETAAAFYYRVVTPGFSQFVITGPTPEEPPNATEPEEPPDDGPTPGPPSDEQQPDQQPQQPESTPEERRSVVVTREDTSIEFTGVPEDGPNLAEVIRVTDLDLPEPGAERTGPLAEITTAANISITGQRIDRDIDLRGADALTLVDEPITLTGVHSLFGSKPGIDDSWRMIKRVEITVPPEYRDQSAVVRITVDRSRFGGTDPAQATIGRLAGDWQLLDTTVVETTEDAVVLQARTPGFSEFAVFGTNSVSYRWDVETHEEPFEGITITPSFDDTGFYDVRLTVTDAYGLTDSANYTILVNDRPHVTIEAPSNVTAGQRVTLRANVTDEMGDRTVTWELPDGSVRSGSEVPFRFEPGEHVVRVTVEDEFGENATNSTRIVVGEPAEGQQMTEIVDFLGGFDWRLLLVIPLGFAVLAALRRLLPLLLAAIDRGHPPEIVDLTTPRLDPENRRIVIESLGVIDRGDDLERIEIAILDREDRTVTTKVIELDGEPRYLAEPEIVMIPRDEPLVDTYRVQITGYDADDRTGIERRELADDASAFIFPADDD